MEQRPCNEQLLLQTTHSPTAAAAAADRAMAATLTRRVHIYESKITGTFDATPSIWRGSLAGEPDPVAWPAMLAAGAGRLGGF